MNAPVTNTGSLRRGVCPGTTNPIRTGDGLLARLIPGLPIPVDDFIALCAASRRHGNGIMEVTQRGSIQVRGLTDASAPAFARSVELLELGGDSRPQILAPALAGLTTEDFDSRALIAQLRLKLVHSPYLASLGPKVSLLVDGAGSLHLDSIPADIRLRAVASSGFYLSMGGNADTAIGLGWVSAPNVVETIDELLARIAAQGTNARAKDLVDAHSIDAIRDLLADRIQDGDPPPVRSRAEPIGRHPLQNGELAVGIGLAFGHTNASVLERFVRAAATRGVRSIQPVFARALLLIGLSHAAADELIAIARDAGFIVEADDPRRHVVACAGSPACSSATLSTRDLAPVIAQAAKSWLDASTTVHLSGCTKGCAHPGVAALTVVGPDRLVLSGRAGDTPDGTVASQGPLAGFERLSAALSAAQFHTNGAALLSRLGVSRVVECFTGVTAGG
ncbi:MAG TPA: precorrin-3B synthase [Steroidobacteraceae bacterium]|jgi:precorrin-3B synthase